MLPDDSIDFRARHRDLISVIGATQFDLIGQLDAVNGAVVGVEHRYFNSADGRFLFRDQMRNRIEIHLPFDSICSGHFDLPRVFAAHLRVTHKRQCQLVLLQIEQPQVVILTRSFQLRTFLPEKRRDFPVAIFVPS